ncbi:MAG: DUF4145 domain-containing protein [Alphaproteobacteria bacterium]|nr:DUF4145 domain-containing protein [Alphaproteobacteria bacterium]
MQFIDSLDLDRCPHCGKAHPSLLRQTSFDTEKTPGGGPIMRRWSFYECRSCGGAVAAWAYYKNGRVDSSVREYFPKIPIADAALPDKVKSYMQQAMETIHAPAGSVMLAACAVDEMLKQRGYIDGKLYNRINQARDDHLITPDMAEWAHEVRLDANDQRHADMNAELPNEDDARRIVDFARALGDILFVLPARVRRGREDANPGEV